MNPKLLLALTCALPVCASAQLTGYTLSPGAAFAVDRGTIVGTSNVGNPNNSGVVWIPSSGPNPVFAFSPYFSFTTLNGISNGVVAGSANVGGSSRAFSVDLNSIAFTDLHPFTATSSNARGISGSFVAGVVDNRPAAWLSLNNSPATLPTPAGTVFGEARAVSSKARFVGAIMSSSGQLRAYLWTFARGGFRATDLTPAAASSAEANAIDFGGTIVGGNVTLNGIPTAHIWNLNTGVNTVLTTPRNTVSAVLGTNGKWHVGVIGQRATLWQTPTRTVDLHSLLPGSFISSVAWAIDVETTAIVGEAIDKDGTRVAVYWR